MSYCRWLTITGKNVWIVLKNHGKWTQRLPSGWLFLKEVVDTKVPMRAAEYDPEMRGCSLCTFRSVSLLL
jgi:hypothetical protein